jgi:hypothetical protein
MRMRLTDLQWYHGQIATIVWHAPEGERADRGRLTVHPSGAVEVHDPDSGELRLSLGWRAVRRLLDVYEGLRDDARFRHLRLARIGAGCDGAEIYLASGASDWRIIQGWDGTAARADVWHRYRVQDEASRFVSTAASLENALQGIAAEVPAQVRGQDRAEGSRVT